MTRWRRRRYGATIIQYTRQESFVRHQRPTLIRLRRATESRWVWVRTTFEQRPLMRRGKGLQLMHVSNHTLFSTLVCRAAELIRCAPKRPCSNVKLESIKVDMFTEVCDAFLPASQKSHYEWLTALPEQHTMYHLISLAHRTHGDRIWFFNCVYTP